MRLPQRRPGEQTGTEALPSPAPGEPDPLRTRGGMRYARSGGRALLGWIRALLLQSIWLAVLWLTALLLLRVPLAPLWAVVAGLTVFIPYIGGVLALLGPVFSILLSGHDMERLLFLLGCYAVIVIIDQLALQPFLMKRITRVPLWASLLVPIVLGILIPFWGVLLAPPLLAVIYAFRRPPSGS